jgi:hypothetical protein
MRDIDRSVLDISTRRCAVSQLPAWLRRYRSFQGLFRPGDRATAMCNEMQVMRMKDRRSTSDDMVVQSPTQALARASQTRALNSSLRRSQTRGQNEVRAQRHSTLTFSRHLAQRQSSQSESKLELWPWTENGLALMVCRGVGISHRDHLWPCTKSRGHSRRKLDTCARLTIKWHLRTANGCVKVATGRPSGPNQKKYLLNERSDIIRLGCNRQKAQKNQ